MSRYLHLLRLNVEPPLYILAHLSYTYVHRQDGMCMLARFAKRSTTWKEHWPRNVLKKWMVLWRKKNEYTSGYSSLLRTISRLLLLALFFWPLAEVCWVWEFGHQHDLAHTERTFSRRLCVWKDSKFNITSFTREEIDSRWVGFHGHIGYYYLTIVCLSFSGLSYFGRPVWLAPQQRRAWVCNASCM